MLGMKLFQFAYSPYAAKVRKCLELKGLAGKAIVRALGEVYLHYDQRRLDTQMRRLRRKVEQVGGLRLPVSTVRGEGYRVYQKIVIDG